jgi:hypothetical protein
MPSTVEDLFKNANEAMQQQVHAPIVLSALAERGYKADDEKTAAALLELADNVRTALTDGTIDPVPAAALEDDGHLSKHASEAVENDFLHFAPDFEINVDEVDDAVKAAAAKMLTAQLVS